MNNISTEIFEKYQARKSKKQKSEFLDFYCTGLEKNGIPHHVEQGGVLKSKNIVIGNVQNAKIIFTAHYDTAPIMLLPLPMIMTPNNKAFYLAIQIVPIAILAFLIRFIMKLLLLPSFTYILIPVLLIGLLFFGRTNRYTANDNTSGVIVLTEAIFSHSLDLDKTAFVLFDNEEKGMWGAGFFAKKHRDILHEKLIINLDCVSDGDHIMVMKDKKIADNSALDILLAKHLLAAPKGKILYIENKCDYLSDQVKFENSVAIVTCNKSKKFGRFISKHHTEKDRVFDLTNIEYLSQCINNMAKAQKQ